MISLTITYADGDTTDTQFDGTPEEARNYYIRQKRCVSIQVHDITIDSRIIAQQVTESLTDHVSDFDVDAIVRDIITIHGLTNINDIDHNTYWTIVEQHVQS